MKAFILGLVVLAVITGGAVLALDAIDMSAKSTYSSSNGSVRH